MNVPSIEYQKLPDGIWSRKDTTREVNPADFKWYYPDEADFSVGIRYEKDGKVIIPEPEDADTDNSSPG